jgi:transposase InsO family protein
VSCSNSASRLAKLHDRRSIVRTAVTEHPTAAWLARQVTEAFPWGTAPRYLLRDRDASYGADSRVEAMGITEVVTAPRLPWQNAYVERVIGSIRRECLDHIVISTSAICGASCPRTSTTTNAPARIFRSTRIAPTHARSCRAGSERWSQSHKSAACIIATNASPPDSHPLRRII